MVNPAATNVETKNIISLVTDQQFYSAVFVVASLFGLYLWNNYANRKVEYARVSAMQEENCIEVEKHNLEVYRAELETIEAMRAAQQNNVNTFVSVISNVAAEIATLPKLAIINKEEQLEAAWKHSEGTV